MQPTITLPAYRETPDNTQWWVMCPEHGYWAEHGGNIGYRTTHCPLCPKLRDFYAYEAGPEDPPLPSREEREAARRKVWRKFNGVTEHTRRQFGDV